MPGGILFQLTVKGTSKERESEVEWETYIEQTVIDASTQDAR